MRPRLPFGLVVALGVVLGARLAGCDNPYVAQPPARFRADRTVTVEFASDTRARCLALGAVLEHPAAGLVGCHHAGTVVLPNPCRWPNASDFRDTACHELGHANRWPADHPQ